MFGPPRQPLLGLVVAGGIGIVVADFCQPTAAATVTGAALAVAVGLVLLRWPQVGVTYLFVAGCFFLLHALRTTDTPGLRLAGRLGERPRVVRVTGTVTSEPKVAPNGSASFLFRLSTLELEEKTERTDATVLAHWQSQPLFGDELRLFGAAVPLAGPRNPGEFDMRSYLARRDVRRALLVRYPEDGMVLNHNGGNAVLRAAQTSRAWLQAALCRGLNDSPEVKNFISGITLGLRHQTSEDIEEPFQQTGTLHLFAVAGLHVGIVGRLLWLLAKVARLSQKWTAAFIIPLLLFYSAVTGLHVSSVRAAVMAAVFLAGFFFERKPFTLNSLAAAAMLLLAWDTNELFSAGFQLSFSVVGAIILLADPLSRRLSRYGSPDPFLPRGLLSRSRRLFQSVTSFLGTASAVSATAWLGSLVLLFWYFHLITPISLLANLAVVPLAFFVLAIALLSVLVAAWFPWLSVIFNNANWLLANLVLGLVHSLAQLPGGHYYFSHPPWLGTTVAKIAVLDLGAGAAVHVRTHRGHWLFDCGSMRDYDHILRPCLHERGVNEVAGLLLSHGDSLHIGGATLLLSELPPSLIIDNPAADRSVIHKRLRTVFREKRFNVQQLTAGRGFELAPNVRAAVLHPPRGFVGQTADDEALVVQLQVFSSTRVLFMSDSGRQTETALLSSGADLRSDILVKGQHHSQESGSEEFLRAVQPRVIIATSRNFPEQERLRDDFVARVREKGIRLFRQDESGAVELDFHRDNWEARSYVTGETFRSSSR